VDAWPPWRILVGVREEYCRTVSVTGFIPSERGSACEQGGVFPKAADRRLGAGDLLGVGRAGRARIGRFGQLLRRQVANDLGRASGNPLLFRFARDS
jgi:hypothetical protein